MSENRKLVCGKCRVPLEPRRTAFQYLKYEAYEELPTCPVCGQVYLDEELVRTRMHDAEIEMEDK